jgi:hypothetical protein
VALEEQEALEESDLELARNMSIDPLAIQLVERIIDGVDVFPLRMTIYMFTSIRTP